MYSLPDWACVLSVLHVHNVLHLLPLWHLLRPFLLQDTFSPAPVLLRCFLRQSKCEPLVEEVELKESNPHGTRPTSGSQMGGEMQYQCMIWLLVVQRCRSRGQTSQLPQLRCHPWLNPFPFPMQGQSKFQLNSL